MIEDKEINLHDSIKNLKSVAKILDAAKFNFKIEDFPDIEKPPQIYDGDLEILLKKFLRGEENLSRKELKNLPHIIYKSEITLDHLKKIWNTIDIDNKRHLSGVIYAYLKNYDNSPKTDFLRQNLNSMKYEGFSKRLKKIFAARDKLFGGERLTNMAKVLAQNLSVDDSLEEVGLSNFYKTSNFIESALKFFFSYNFANLSDRMKLLAKLDAEYNDYKNIFSAVAYSIIQSVYRAGSFKEQCIKIFYSRLGDPRFNNSRLNWRGVSQKSQEIFCHWLSEKDLEVFFKIIKQTALDNMWRHREKFWRAYLPHIVNTKIFLGPSARYVAANLEGVKLNYGNLQSAEANQSVFVFQIGRYIFSEWSHNGSLRIYRTNNAATNFFEYNSIARHNLTENFIVEQTHHSPESYSWQKKISDWILKHCNIYKTERDWGLR